MSVRIITDQDQRLAVLYCSTSMWAFGPVFSDDDDDEKCSAAQACINFLNWCGTYHPPEHHVVQFIGFRADPRGLTEAGLECAVNTWRGRDFKAHDPATCPADVEGGPCNCQEATP
jgi:hypothetical protein